MAEKRKSGFKCPPRCRRNRSSNPALDLLSPYLPGPELFICPPMSSIQMRPAYSSASFDSSLSNTSSFLMGYAPSPNTNSTLSFGANSILQIPTHSTLSLVLSKIFQLD